MSNIARKTKFYGGWGLVDHEDLEFTQVLRIPGVG